MRKLVIASTNKGKIKEIKEVLDGFEFLSLTDFPKIKEIEETGKTFEENALIKAKTVYDYANAMTLADDSGLEVDELNGAPGVYSARYSGEGAADDKNCEKLLNELKDIPKENRTARFRCVIVLYNGENDKHIFNGTCEGKIINEKRGTNGFGYDPLFVPNGYNKTFAELDSETKNKISHRGKALEQLKNYLNKL